MGLYTSLQNLESNKEWKNWNTTQKAQSICNIFEAQIGQEYKKQKNMFDRLLTQHANVSNEEMFSMPMTAAFYQSKATRKQIVNEVRVRSRHPYQTESIPAMGLDKNGEFKQVDLVSYLIHAPPFQSMVPGLEEMTDLHGEDNYFSLTSESVLSHRRIGRKLAATAVFGMIAHNKIPMPYKLVGTIAAAGVGLAYGFVSTRLITQSKIRHSGKKLVDRLEYLGEKIDFAQSQ